MNLDFNILRPGPSRRWILRSLATAGLILACMPIDPGGPCSEDISTCNAREYYVRAMSHGPSWNERLPSDSSGAALLDSLPVSFVFDQVRSFEVSSACRRGGSGIAWAMSCASCSDYFRPDSIYLTTDFVGPDGDTLKAGMALSGNAKISGLRFDGSAWFQIDSGSFRDSSFEVRFFGKLDSMPRAVTRQVRVRNPALLF